MTQSTSDPLAPLGPDGVVTAGGGTATPMLDKPRPEARERIHRFAGTVHRAIDNLERTLSSKSRDVMSTQSRYGGQARQYGETLREQINARPLQSAGLALGAGVVLNKIFSRAPTQVRVVKVPVATRSSWDPTRSPDRRSRRWMDTADSRMQGIKGAGQEAAGKVGAAAGWGMAGTEAMASTLTRKASTLPLQMRLATQRLLARSQEYGSMARSGVQAHPLAGVGAMLGAGALLTTVWMQRRRPTTPGTAYVTVDEKGNGVAWQRDGFDAQPRARDMITSRPLASAVVMLGLGALAGAMLKRQ